MHESHWVSILKAFSWRFVASTATALLVYGFTGNMTAAISIGSLEAVLKIFLYYVHERAWHFAMIKSSPLRPPASKEA